jgi:hypothetical protein
MRQVCKTALRATMRMKNLVRDMKTSSAGGGEGD